MRTRHLETFLLAGAAALAACADVTVTQTLTLYSGWNAVYLEVSPTASLGEVFADWPVKSVGFYDPASFLATRQFSQDWDSQGVSMKPIATWHRDYPEASQVAWNPEPTKSGTCRWKLTNLMRQGPITLVGDMTLKRVSPQTELVLE